MPHTVIKSRHTNVKNHSEISRYFSVHVLPCSLRNSKELAKFYHVKLLAEQKHAMIVSHYINITFIPISCLILSLNLVSQMWKNHSEIFRYFSVHVLPCSLRNSKELAKFYHFKLPWRLPGQQENQTKITKGLNHGCLTVFVAMVIRWNCFSKMWRILLPHLSRNNGSLC